MTPTPETPQTVREAAEILRFGGFLKAADKLDAAAKDWESSEQARQRAERLLAETWWSRDLHGCRFCFAKSGQFSSPEMVRHAADCSYAALAPDTPKEE